MFRTKVLEKIKISILCSITILENRAVYKKMWKNIVQPTNPQMKIRLLRIAWKISKATNTHSQYVIFIVFPLHNVCTKSSSIFRYKYIASLGQWFSVL